MTPYDAVIHVIKQASCLETRMDTGSLLPMYTYDTYLYRDIYRYRGVEERSNGRQQQCEQPRPPGVLVVFRLGGVIGAHNAESKHSCGFPRGNPEIWRHDGRHLFEMDATENRCVRSAGSVDATPTASHAHGAYQSLGPCAGLSQANETLRAPLLAIQNFGEKSC